MALDDKSFSKTEGLDHQTTWFARLGAGRAWLPALTTLAAVWIGQTSWLDGWSWPWIVLPWSALACLSMFVLYGAPRVGFVLRPKSLQVLWRTSLSVHSRVQIALDELEAVQVVESYWGPQLHLVRSHGEALVVRVGAGPESLQHLEQLAADILERRDLYLATPASGEPEADRRALQALSRQVQGQR